MLDLGGGEHPLGGDQDSGWEGDGLLDAHTQSLPSASHHSLLSGKGLRLPHFGLHPIL